MQQDARRRLALAGCLVNALALTTIQVAAAVRPPFFLFAIFTGVWLFGALMLLLAPRFGAAGTAIYGVILAIAVLAQHGALAQNLLLAATSLATAALAAWSLAR